jgi:uncharacterized protein YfaS (alpha-2-macroglobulin family)
VYSPISYWVLRSVFYHEHTLAQPDELIPPSINLNISEEYISIYEITLSFSLLQNPFEGDSYSYTLPITDEYAPNVFIEVLLMRGVTQQHPNPQYERGQIELTVEPSARRLNVEILPSVETAQPGESVPIQIRVTDREGRPVEAEVGVAVTNEAALAVYNGTSWTMEDIFYGSQSDSVSDSISLKLLLTNPIHAGGGVRWRWRGKHWRDIPTRRFHFYTSVDNRHHQ